MIKDVPFQSVSSVSGVTLFLRCPTLTPQIATHSTAGGALTAFLIRGDEYLGDVPRLDIYGKRLPSEPTDAAGLLDATGPLRPGVYPLAGSIKVSSDERFVVGLLELDLDTRDAIPPDPAGLARRAAPPRPRARPSSPASTSSGRRRPRPRRRPPTSAAGSRSNGA